MKRSHIPFCIFILLALPGCPTLFTPDDDLLVLEGRVELIEVDCGGWGILTSEDLYETVELPQSFRKDGLRVRAEVQPRRDLVSCTMVGPIVEIVRISQR